LSKNMADIFGTAQNEVLSATSATGDNVYGQDGDDLLIGGNGSDLLSGGAGNDAIRDYGSGADTLAGGTGDDLYCIVSEGDSVVENAGEGTDTVETQVNYVLGANLENLTLNYGANGTGNELNNVISDGTGDNNIIFAMGGNDTVYAGGGNDSIDGGDGSDLIYGGAGNDAISDYGNGSDTLAGGIGDDRYCLLTTGDSVVENAGEGIDTVETQIDYVLGANVENLILNYGANGTGNELSNVITDGTGANNIIFAMGGDDTVDAGGGNDSIDGGDGSDMIYGGAGNDAISDYGSGSDTLAGGIGDDRYCILTTGDLVVENIGEGIDTVETQIDYVLGANVENLILNYGANGTGNELNNVITDGTGANNIMSGLGGDDTILGGIGNDTIYGGEGNDSLDGGTDNDFITGDAGNDTMSGGEGADSLYGGAGQDLIRGGNGNDFIGGDAGDDQMFGDAGDDQMFGGEGADTMSGGIGNDLLSGESGNDVLNGDEGDDTIYGGEGKDVITGGNGNDTLVTGQGNDILTGGAGNDVFSFQAPAGLLGYDAAVVGTSTITDFASGSDQIGISACLIGGFGYYGALQAADFASVSNEAEYNDAICGNAKIIYNSSNGNLFYNANGADAGLGNGSQFATVQGAPALTTSDFQVQW
jgi:Ca2+-binding RTX toxin-like protein